MKIGHSGLVPRDALDGHRSRITSNNDSTALYHSLNGDQCRIVDNAARQFSREEQPLWLFMSGEGGTGKSRVIHTLQQAVSDNVPCQ